MQIALWAVAVWGLLQTDRFASAAGRLARERSTFVTRGSAWWELVSASASQMAGGQDKHLFADVLDVSKCSSPTHCGLGLVGSRMYLSSVLMRKV